MSARFVSVLRHTPLLLALVLADLGTAQTNLALAGTATQSSTGFGGVAGRGIDGNTDPNWSSMTLTHTGDVADSWWEVDLGGDFSIEEIRLFNRGDCCWARLSNFRVSVFDGATEVFGEDAYTGTGNVPQAGTHSVFPPSGTTGDRVRVQILGLNNDNNGFLTLAEVEVYDDRIGTSYCGPAVSNSTGSWGATYAAGSAVIVDDDVTLTAAGLPTSSFGVFMTSRTQATVAQPSGSLGVLCLGGAIGPFAGPGQIQNSGALGTFDLLLDLTQMPTPTGLVPIAPGETWNFQCWYRDSVAGTATSNFTDACSVVFQ